MERGEMIIDGEKYRTTFIGRPDMVVDDKEIYSLNLNKRNIGSGRIRPLQIIGNAETTSAIHRNAGGNMIVEFSDCSFKLYDCKLAEKSDLDNDIVWIEYNSVEII